MICAYTRVGGEDWDLALVGEWGIWVQDQQSEELCVGWGYWGQATAVDTVLIRGAYYYVFSLHFQSCMHFRSFSRVACWLVNCLPLSGGCWRAGDGGEHGAHRRHGEEGGGRGG